jgi:hypothetical protein
MVDETHYGQLLAIYDLTVDEELFAEIDKESELEADLPDHFLLGLVHPCPTNGLDATAQPVFYRATDFKNKPTIIIDMKDIENVVGRVELPGYGCFGIVDRVMGCARLTFTVDENDCVREV